MNILMIEPFFGGSHRSWIEGYKRNSAHMVDILSLPGERWKLRMREGANALAHEFLTGDYSPDLLFASDMLDLDKFLEITKERTAEIPTAIYFHENQLTYPWSPRDKKAAENRALFGEINIKSALCVDKILFNSAYHMKSFLNAAEKNLKENSKDLSTIETIRKKSSVLHLGMDLKALKAAASSFDLDSARPPLLLWNHRWEYDKNPSEFFLALYALADKGVEFEVAVLGEHFTNVPKKFAEARERLGKRVIQFGFTKSREDYARFLKQADILPVTSIHDFFGSSVIEAVSMGVFPLLPRRLAYPEHIPPEKYPDCFYNDFDELISMLETAIKNIEKTRSLNLSGLTARYDWSKLAPLYDRELEQVSALNAPA